MAVLTPAISEFRLSFTYVLSSHTLADDLGVLVDKHEWPSLVSVDATRSSGSEHRVCARQPGGHHGSSGQHYFLLSIIYNLFKATTIIAIIEVRKIECSRIFID